MRRLNSTNAYVQKFFSDQQPQNGVCMLLHKKKLYASKKDRSTHGLFSEAGVIVPHNSEYVAGKQTCSCCSDGFRFHMTEGVFGRCKENGGDETFFHQFKGNGEAMRFAYRSPLSEGFSRYGDLDVWGRMKINEVSEVLGWADDLDVSVEQHRLVHHWPCKAALSRSIDLAQSIDLVIRGKLRFKHQISDIKVGIDFFCDWGKDDFTTELIKKEPYLKLIETDPRFARERDEWSVYAELVKKLPVLR